MGYRQGIPGMLAQFITFTFRISLGTKQQHCTTWSIANNFTFSRLDSLRFSVLILHLLSFTILPSVLSVTTCHARNPSLSTSTNTKPTSPPSHLQPQAKPPNLLPLSSNPHSNQPLHLLKPPKWQTKQPHTKSPRPSRRPLPTHQPSPKSLP